jgi:hypothetical protein
VNPRAAAAGGSTVIVAGSLVTFSDGVRQQAAAWRRDGGDQPWQLLRLPDAGTASEGLSAGCAGSCWLSGRADGSVALWRLDPRPAREPAFPARPVDVDGPGPRVVLPAGTGPGVLSSTAGQSVLALSVGGRWRSYTGPAGTVVDAAATGSRLYAVLRNRDRSTLWTTDVAQLPS